MEAWHGEPGLQRADEFKPTAEIAVEEEQIGLYVDRQSSLHRSTDA
jgi:hypothetical protein